MKGKHKKLASLTRNLFIHSFFFTIIIIHTIIIITIHTILYHYYYQISEYQNIRISEYQNQIETNRKNERRKRISCEKILIFLILAYRWLSC
jgi:hypothetical protein